MTDQRSGEDNGSTEIEGDDGHLHDDQKAETARNVDGDDGQPDSSEPNKTPGGLKPEDVEDRPNVGTVKPDDYAKDLPDH